MELLDEWAAKRIFLNHGEIDSLIWEGEKMNKLDIANRILYRVEHSAEKKYSSWSIGITQSTQERKTRHEEDGTNTDNWEHWQANSLKDAMEVETYFINYLGMNGCPSDELNPLKVVYVYIL